MPFAIRLPLDIVKLSTHQLAGSGGFGQGPTACGRHRRGMDPCGQGLEGQGQEGIAGKDGHSLPKLTMTCWKSTPQVVIVHRRQVVVDERIGVDHLDGAGRRHGRVKVAAARFRGPEDQQRPQPFAGGEETITDRLAEPTGAARGKLRASRQGRVDAKAGIFGSLG
jgi:hypothetical protein